MATYVDSSVLVSALLEEDRTLEAQALLDFDEVFYSSWLAYLEVRRRISLVPASVSLDDTKAKFEDRLGTLTIANIEKPDWNLAAEIAENTRLKSLDALHLAVASNLELQNLTFLTFDKKQAAAARSLGFSVVGA